jgi:predicted ATPase
MCVDVVFFGPVGSGKSSLIGSLYRAVNVESHFPERVAKVLHHNPGNTDTHGTLTWMETSGNRLGTIIYQDTRGDQVKGCLCLSVCLSETLNV